MTPPNPSLRNFTDKKGLIERLIRIFDLDKARLLITIKGKSLR